MQSSRHVTTLDTRRRPRTLEQDQNAMPIGPISVGLGPPGADTFYSSSGF